MSAQQPIMDRRSLGLKFLLVCALAVLMSIPAFGVFGLISERTSRAQGVVAEVGDRLGGEQTVVGPILVAPYRATVAATDANGRPTQQVVNGWYAVFAANGSADANVDTEEKQRGDLFKVRAYTADIGMNASFDLSAEPSALPANAQIDWSEAVLIVGVSDPRGVMEAANVQIQGGAAIPFRPGSAYQTVFTNLQGASANGRAGSDFSNSYPVSDGRAVQWLVADVGEIARPGAQFALTTRLKISGAESLSLTAFARNTELRMHGDWPHVGYYGAYAAEAADAEEGFDSRWSVPLVRRNLADAGATDTLSGLGNQAVTTRFVDPSNPYQAVTRSLKYALLFIGVVFLAYFLFEATSDQRVHPAQYVLVGLAQIIFYLLLLAIAERLGFDWAFLIAASATVLLIGWYAGAVFKSRQRQYAAIAAFTVLYALIYVLMSLEDFALLVGALAAFIAIAAVMWFTRNLDWYGLGLTNERRQNHPS
ncbi:MAG: cell envelope integrity protein CreD [Caulobacterales bacterium]